MPIASLKTSPLAPGVSPVHIHYRDEGEGVALVLLHGGWGCTLNPFNRQLETLRDEFRVVCPDRSGYGGSTRRVDGFACDFHYRAATETLNLLDALGIERAFFWGHSDGAVIAAIIGFTAPERVRGLILEAFHYYRLKPSSRKFFETLASEPEALGEELCAKFAMEFGVDHWRRLITSHAKTWREIALAGSGPLDDLYGGRLHEVSAPTLLIHGRFDPRTEPGELDAVAVELPHAELRMFEAGGHGPHNEPASADDATRLAREFLRRHSIDFLGPRASRPQ
ncbi:MAG TPA: alpha/beta hydrolase [Pyrinomonadaceae bacterium]|jgi:pimeloyl-ACP methyl ester carboxylesterase|nr:alpha/beta hydrolase [Pyrinomonadaceae bacterium]